MSPTNKGLGRGLDALFQKSPTPGSEGAAEGYQRLPLDSLEPNPHQPRKSFSSESLQELAQSIKKQGLLQPLLVRPSQHTQGRYEIIAGERRWRACHLAQVQELPAIVSELSDSESMIVGLMENLQREDLDPVEEAEGLYKLQELADISQDELARRVGSSRSRTANSLRLLRLEPEILEALREQRISASQARNLLAFENKDIRWKVFELLLQNRLTIRDLENVVSYYKQNGCLPGYLAQTPSKTKNPSDSGFRDLRKKLQQDISERFQTPVRIRGSREKGSVSFSYQSKQELYQLLQRLGVEENSDVSRETGEEV